MNRLFLLDGMALAYRAHFALIRNPITTSKGVNSSALYGFTNTLLDLIEKQHPTHFAVAFDTSAPTPRHELYPEYKAQREAMPEDLSAALPQIRRLCQAMKIPLIIHDGWEADDLIGTYAKAADQAGDFETFMVTPDKDFAQLVTPTISMYKPGRKGGDVEILGVEEVKEKWGVNDPLQVIDILALWGDASDNIPGVPGIGQKTAAKLIQQFDSVEGILENVSKLKGKQKENVQNNVEQLKVSKTLTTIVTDCPMEFSLEELKRQDFDAEALKEIFIEFEFNTLGRRLLGDDFKAGRGFEGASEAGGQTDLFDQGEAPAEVTLTGFDAETVSYKLVDTQAAFEALKAEIKDAPLVCFDLESTSLNPQKAEIVGIAIALKEGAAYFVSLIKGSEIQEAQLVELLTFNQPKVGHNLKYDLSLLKERNLAVEGTCLDTMIAHALIAPDKKHSMDYLAESMLGYETLKFEALFEPEETSTSEGEEGADDDLFTHAAKKSKKKTVITEPIDYSEVPIQRLSNYACEDADITLRLWNILEPQLETSGVRAVFDQVETPLLPVLVDMESEGINMDEASLGEISMTLAEKIDQLQTSIYETSGHTFNLNSPKQLGEVLFGEMQLVEKPKKTKTGNYVTNEQVLSSLAPKHPIVADILSYRQASKLKSTYVDALPTHSSEKDGRIHTSFHQVMTATGRLASANPNLQNIPIRSEMGKEVRGAFVPRSEEFTLLAADYSQVELRVMAAMAEDQAMIDAFKSGTDIHTATAARVYGVELDGVEDHMRRTAKMVNFGIIYGISAFGLSQRLGIPRKEASTIIEAYFEQYTGVKTFMDTIVQKAQDQGYVETLGGRRRYLPDLTSANHTVKANAERAAINTPIQGSAADMIKLAMVRVDRLLKERDAKTKMLLQVHDELVFDLHQDEHHLIPDIKLAMEQALPLPHDVPTLVETGIGNTWLEAH